MKFSTLFYFSGIIFLSFSCNNSPESSSNETMKATINTQDMTTNDKKLRHAVFFKFKESATQDDIDQVQKAFSALPGKIPQIKGYEWGTNNSPEGHDKGFTHCFFLTFDSEEGRAAYLPHPDHKAFGKILGPHLEDVFVFDYWTHEE